MTAPARPQLTGAALAPTAGALAFASFSAFWTALPFHLGVQGAHVSNQARIFALDEAARGRINAVYMVAYFAGVALGVWAVRRRAGGQQP